MSTFNLNIDQCTKDQFPIDLFFTGNQIYKSIVSLAKSTAGVVILVPLALASIIIVPLTYFLIVMVLTYYLFRLKYVSKGIKRMTVTVDNYTPMYDLYLGSNKALCDLKRIATINNKSKELLVAPVKFYVNRFHEIIFENSKFLEQQLFEVYDPGNLPEADIDNFRSQIKGEEDDWGDDELWRDFQSKHHHLSN